MSVYAVNCPEKQFFVNATGWTDAFIQTCKLRAREFNITETSSQDIHIDKVNRFMTIYGEWLDFEKNTMTTCHGRVLPLDSTEHYADRNGKRYTALMEYKGKTYPQSVAITIE